MSERQVIITMHDKGWSTEVQGLTAIEAYGLIHLAELRMRMQHVNAWSEPEVKTDACIAQPKKKAAKQ